MTDRTYRLGTGTGLFADEPYIEVEARLIRTISGPRTLETFRWVGPTYRPVRIDLHAARRLDLEALPWPLAEIDRNPMNREVTMVRADGINRPAALLWRMRYAVRNPLRLIFARLMFTAEVWGLADIPVNERPSLRHLRLPLPRPVRGAKP